MGDGSDDAASEVTTRQDSDVDERAIRQLLDDVRTGACSADDAVARLRSLPFTEMGFARIDHHRALRQGMHEVVYGPGKTPRQCAAIVQELLADSDDAPVLLTRADSGQAECVSVEVAGGVVHGDPTSGRGATIVWRPRDPRPDLLTAGPVMVITAGTADLPVADECVAVLNANGVPVERRSDVGVAGLHRLADTIEPLLEARAVVVVAGMEGALASVVGGITPAPVVAVPTSVGYGSSLEGVTALLGMLASCASGMTVVGIDNGFGAACAVMRILGPVGAIR